MSSALWIAGLGAASLATLLLRATVRIVARKADNGWDNALAYMLCSAVLTVPVAWLAHTLHWFFLALVPVVFWAGQTIALSSIYELRPFHAWLVGVSHTILTGLVLSLLAFIGGAIALYVIYGKIVADPVAVLRWLLEYLGVPWPG